MTDTTQDDLVKRLRDLGDHASFEPHMHHTAADRIEELEAKLAQQDDLVQAAVAAALREAATLCANVSTADLKVNNPTYQEGYSDGAGVCHYEILSLFTLDAQAALDRVVQAQQGARPIATAPRDGTHILVAPYGDPTDLQVSWFIDGEDRWANWSWSVEPSHWFPLPAIRKGEE